MHALRTCLLIIDKINEWVAKLASWAIILIIGSTAYEVIMRYVFASPTEWSFELNYLTNGVYFLLLGAFTFAVRGHVNVDIFYARFSPRTRAIVDLLTAPLFFFFISMMLIFGGQFALDSLASRETLSSAWAPPIYPVKIVIPVAATMLILQGIAKFIRDLHTAITGKEELL
ncbi:MAG: TRAP transporter small permease subunit [Desulfobacteraceae bacterium]|nr:MAG: TRAP transporter small permease subunit [Desulfobacteraceae bacterium]